MKPTDFSYHLSNYLAKYLPGVMGLSPNTILSYRDTFAALVCFYESILLIKAEKICLSDFNANHVIRYLDWLENTRHNAVSTRNNRLAAIHAFAKYIERNLPERMYDMQEIVAIPLKKGSSIPPKYLSKDALQLLLSLPDRNASSGRRDGTLLSLLYDSGARAQELCDIIVSDIRVEQPSTVKLKGKGDKTRIVPLMPPMVSLLRQYLKERGLIHPDKGCLPLFINHCGDKLTRKGVSHILEKYYQKAKLLYPGVFAETISPHNLRHSKSMHLLQSGVNLIYIRDILGHSDIKTTEIYARIDSEMKRKALESVTVGVASESQPVWQKDKGLLDWLKSLG
jgi:site-specific recombinase XerD